MKVFFFGAGASKSCGFLLASELLKAIYSPLIGYGINVKQSRHKSVVDMFEKDREICMIFTELIRDDRPLDYNMLTEIFSTIENRNPENLVLASKMKPGVYGLDDQYFDLKQAIVFNELERGHMPLIRNSFMSVFSTLLNPAYYRSSNPGSYGKFVEWTKKQQDWTVILSTNWDYLLDIYIDWQYGVLDEIDEGMVDLQSDRFVPYRMLGNKVFGKSVSLFKLNGSLNWLYCPKDKKFYGTLFQPPYNLTAVSNSQSAKFRQAVLTGKSLDQIPLNWVPGNCPNCGTYLEYRVYTPGISRSTFPIASRMLENTLFATENCNELVFIGFSCPEEDKDSIQLMGEALKRNSLYKAGKLIPVVVQTPGPHREETIRRYEEALQTEVNYREDGFSGWVDTLP